MKDAITAVLLDTWEDEMGAPVKANLLDVFAKMGAEVEKYLLDTYPEIVVE